jgi:transposase
MFRLGRDGKLSMTTTECEVYGGVDTHGKTHHAALDSVGRLLDDREFPANSPATDS